MSKIRVLLLAGNLFSSTPNGGSRFYEKIVHDNPNVKFVSFSQTPKECSKTPLNLEECDIRSLSHMNPIEALFSSMSGESFDVIDWPDWVLPPIHPRELIKKHRIKNHKLIVGLHGSTSKVLSHSFAYRNKSNEIKSFQRDEDRLYKTSDGIYGISKYYSEDLGLLKKTRIIDPIKFFKTFPKENRFATSPKMNFVGRRDGTKGFGNFLELSKCLPSSWKASIYGPDSYIFEEACEWNRQTFLCKDKITQNLLLSESELEGLYKDRSGVFTFLSNFDSFNLAAADAFSAGQFCLVRSNLPALRYLQDIGIQIPDEMIFSNETYDEIITKCEKYINNPQHVDQLEVLRREIQTRIVSQDQSVSVENMYGD